MPAKGPRPTATTKSMAKTSSLMARQASISRRTGWWTHQGVRFSEDSRLAGMATSTASRVPQMAIWMVTIIWST